jgi:AraC-like DNA-binding protein
MVPLPAMGQVPEASPERPYLSLRLHLDLDEIARLLLQLGDRGPPPADSNRGLFVARMDEALLDAVLRMVKLLDAPDDISVLAPVVQREIYYRMPRGDRECATAGHRVGYESASQFSREYRRLFGAPPRTEIARLRETGVPT